MLNPIFIKHSNTNVRYWSNKKKAGLKPEVQRYKKIEQYNNNTTQILSGPLSSICPAQLAYWFGVCLFIV